MIKLEWSQFNSGGGCMIYCANIEDGMSFQMSDECLVLTKIPHEEYWAMEHYEDQEKQIKCAVWLRNFDDISVDIKGYLETYNLEEYQDQVVAKYNETYNDEDFPEYRGNDEDHNAEDETIWPVPLSVYKNRPFSKACVLPNGYTFTVHETDTICGIYDIFEEHGFIDFFAPFCRLFIKERRDVRKGN